MLVGGHESYYYRYNCCFTALLLPLPIFIRRTGPNRNHCKRHVSGGGERTAPCPTAGGRIGDIGCSVVAATVAFIVGCALADVGGWVVAFPNSPAPPNRAR